MKCTGPQPVIQYVLKRIADAYHHIGTSQGDNYIKVLSQIESGIFVMTETAKVIKPEELPLFSDLITLIYKLPQDYIALRLQNTEFIIGISHLLKD